MEYDLHLTSPQYSLVLSIFFVGYLLWEVPSNMMLSRSKPAIFLPTIMFIWGAMSIGVKGVTSLGGMVAFRFFLGIVEAGFFPGVMLLVGIKSLFQVDHRCRVGTSRASCPSALRYSTQPLSSREPSAVSLLVVSSMDSKAKVVSVA